MKALVLAAGRSTRIRAVAGDLPKPLLPVEGRPILENTLRWVATSGIGDVWIYRMAPTRKQLHALEAER